MVSALPFDTLAAARDALRLRKISAVELTRAVLDRIDALDGTIRAYIDVGGERSVFAERALTVAAEVDAGTRTGLLAGLPIAIKDNLCTTFGRTTCSSKMLENFHSPYDATAVQKLEAAGAVIVGKTNLDEFAMGSSTENSAFGTSRNPWDTDCVPGGSSGGSAAALAAGLCLGSIGSDTGGSIRQPASLCSLVGLKPTYGRISRYGLVAFASSLDQIGPFGWTVADAALLLQAMAGYDRRDSTSAPVDVPDYLAELDVPLKGLRIGIAREYDHAEGVDPQVKSAVDEAVKVYRSLGATTVDVSLPHTKYGIAAYYVIAPCEASSNLARYDGVHYGHRTKEPVTNIFDLYSKSRAEGFGPEVQRRIMIGTYALSKGYGERLYHNALCVRAKIKQDFDEAFQSCDVIACPTSPEPAFKVGQKSGDPLAMYLADVFTVTCNIAAIAGISVPCGFTTDAKPLPIGFQLLGPAFSEPKLLRAARMYEAATEWHKRRPGSV
ncbi:Asp-tRNA(Asn)/Glu-tRNA(Gln) amidotransferase subunit GatA [Humisphaera borealis]|uniref:Glutamyl-tRNA(Gln) amidotransferase subunit A n=1 Tax=Humisphaera borealis TaxID=2807512 RepID=A0A7M2X3C6_9BACT|nr:Asp-tRNA(Asn)/Glu-tRNA(Gln) amidotransferase subunit GatA [Humisphaera borealis]QOV92266.1 Asp-tRNA(Asn)/Glu-tRNA(Gln) amidotransferase subunit GatA [Humisphaera borealis]